MLIPDRIGIDVGGSKIEGVVLAGDDSERMRHRVATPRGDYAGTICAIADVVARLEAACVAPAGATAAERRGVGIGMPGSISPATGLVQNANSTWLNGRPFLADLGAALDRPVRVANDANCFALSEAIDGAGAGAGSVFGVIVGTGCGGGIVIDGRLVDGPRGIGGEWGHTPLPWAHAGEHPGPRCWCGRHGCMETWVSGPALARDHAMHGPDLGLPVPDAEAIAAQAAAGVPAAQAALGRHATRLARGLAMIVNIIDPEVIVLGGGLSRLDHLYATLPGLMAPYVFADQPRPPTVRPPRFGDASGARGAARLWDR